LKKYLKSWIFAIIGGLMILGSVSLNGIIVYNNEKSLREIQEDMNDIDRRFQKANEAYNNAIIMSQLADIQRSVIRYSSFQDEDIQNEWDGIRAAELNSEILYLNIAIGKHLTDDFVKTIGDLTIKCTTNLLD